MMKVVPLKVVSLLVMSLTACSCGGGATVTSNTSGTADEIAIAPEPGAALLTAAELPESGLKINFSNVQTSAPVGFFRDDGQGYRTGRGDGTQVFGWVNRTTGTPSSIRSYSRNRAPNPDLDTIRETLVHMDHPDFNGNDREFRVELPNGQYRVLVQVGDAAPENVNGVTHQINAEGSNLINLPKAAGEYGVKNATGIVTINDGILNIDQVGGKNTKINLLIVEDVDNVNTPAILGSTPVDGAADVSLDTTISANFLHLPNATSNGATSINNSTITTTTVQLFALINGDWIAVSGSVNGTGGGDAINFTPSAVLSTDTRYRYVINGVEDLAGVALLPFSMEFTTGDTVTSNTGFTGIAFEKIGPIVSGINYSSLTMGPDNRLYGLSIAGTIDRWDVNDDGTLRNQQTISTLNDTFAGLRLAVGFAFDPDATASNLIAYITHTTFTFSGGAVYDSEVSMLSGANLQNHQHLITGLPRSVRDHLSNSIAFRPGEPDVLYFPQGSNSAGGEPDGAWGNRPERLLTAALLRLDLNKLPDTLPLNVRTSDNQAAINASSTSSPLTNDGFYNPYYSEAPLTLYATGIRNAYDLVWHSNGQAYVPTNGTGGGSNSPASVQGTRRPDGTFYSGQSVPSVSANSTQRDFLFRVNPSQRLPYFGHPNPLRGEYVLNRASADTNTYSSAILPDANYRGFAFDFEFNRSPNGVIEYKSNAHNGALKGAILVARYSGGSDIIALRPNGPNGDIKDSAVGIEGTDGFIDPLELTEDTRNGNIYVSDYGNASLYLLRPIAAASTEPPIDESTEISINSGYVLEAEDAQLSGALVQSLHDGASQSAYVNFINPSSDYIEWSVNILRAGTDNVFFRYALDGNGSRQMALSVDGNFVSNINFLPTSSWSNWGYASAVVQLRSGTPKIRLTAIGHSGPNIDSMTVLAVDTPPANGFLNNGVVVEAESQVLSGSVVKSDSTVGATNDAFVDFINANNDYLEWNLIASNSGPENLFIRYALGSRNNRTMQLSVNNSVVGTVDFTSTAEWDQWGMVSTVVSLNAGNNRIRLTAIGDGGPNIDSITGLSIAGASRSSLTIINDRFANAAEDVFAFFEIESNKTPDSIDLTERSIEINNNGTETLFIDSLSVSGAGFSLVNTAQASGGIVSPGDSMIVDVRFNQNRRGVYAGTLNFQSNAGSSIHQVPLRGVWASAPEGSNEPTVDEITDLFGWANRADGTILTRNQINFRGAPMYVEGDASVVIDGDTQAAYYFEVADKSQPTVIQQIAAFHSRGTSARTRVFGYNHNPASGDLNDASAYNNQQTLVDFRHDGDYGQSILVPLNGSPNTLAQATINHDGPFMFDVENREGDPARNDGIQGLRMMEIYDQQTGVRIKDAYIMVMDYAGSTANFDYQDNIFVVTNIKPFMGN